MESGGTGRLTIQTYSLIIEPLSPFPKSPFTMEPTWPQRLKRMFTQPILYLAGLYFTYVQRTYKVNGLEFHIPRDLTDIPFRGWFPIGRYEREERKYLAQYLRRDATVLELGACLGVVSGLTNQLLANPLRHVVVEANPALIPWLARNRATNDSEYHIEHCIISAQKENTFYIDDVIVLGSTKRRQGKPVQVLGKTIQELEASYQLAFDTLIMDIEGGELEFFEANRSILSQFRQIFMEVHPFGGMLTATQVSRCEDLLTQAGMRQTLRDGHFQVWEKEVVNARVPVSQ